MLKQDIKNFWRLAVSFGLLSLAVLVLSAQTAVASHQGPPLMVDAASSADEDGDSDYHFRTIQGALSSPFMTEYATISVKPGRYAGDIVVKLEGVKLISTGGPLQTIIDGSVHIQAHDVQLVGFSIEAGERATAVRVEGQGASLLNNRIYDAAHGVEIIGVQKMAVKQNQIYNHSGDALVVKDSWDVEFSENELRGNGGAGAIIEGAHDFKFEKNLVTFNRFGGLWIKDSQRLSVAENSIQDNDIVGLSLDGVSEAGIKKNQFLSNEVGMVLTRAIDNAIEENVMKQGRSAGLVVKNSAHGNTFSNNAITGNQGKGATGIRLAGDVFDNQFIKNKVVENGSGLVLAQNETGTPSNNRFEENEFVLSDSRGIQIEPFAQRNRFIKNRVLQNLQEGVSNSGDSTIFERNDISQNGTVGLLLQNSANARAEGNSIKENGTAGITLENSAGALLSQNEITDNVREGVQIASSNNLRILSNVVSNNGSSGLSVSDSDRVTLLDNTVADNQDLGISVVGVQNLVMQQNTITANGLGGVLLDRVETADLEANLFADNLRYGLFASNSSGVSALRNYWGDSAGPSGTFTGHGDAVLGLEMEEVTPWLPAKPQELQLRSLTGTVLDSPEGPRIVFDATDRLGIILELYNPGLNGTDLAAMGIVLAARYASRPEGLPGLEKELGFYSINVEGLNSGTAEITILYREEDQPPGLDPNKVQIFLFKDGLWRALSGTTNPNLRRVTGEISIDDLQGAVIGLGTSVNSQNLPVVENPRKDWLPWLGLKGPVGPLGSTLLLMLLALSPVLMLLGFYGLARAVRRGSAPSRRKIAYIFRIWNL